MQWKTMNSLRYILSIISFLLSTWGYANKEIDSLLNVLDHDISNYSIYEKNKKERVENLKSTTVAPNSIDRYALNFSIYNEYKTYSSDSAFHYLYQNLSLAQQLQNYPCEIETLLEEVYLLTCVGMYLEAKDVLSKINRSTIPPSLLGRYYMYSKRLFFETGVSLPRNKHTSKYYRNIGLTYRDSILQILPPTDDAYLSEKMFQSKEKRDYSKAMHWNDERMKSATFGTALYALVAYDRAGILKTMGKDDESLYYLILSAISDVRSAIQEQSSIMLLAQIMYERGDINRANTYINFSWRVTEAYNTRMRNWRHIIPYSMINSRFKEIISKQNEKLQSYLLLITLLTFLLGVALIYVYRQMSRLKVAKEKQQSLNRELSEVNNKLEKINNHLQMTNLELIDSNNIKEVYISRFFKLCSTYVDRMYQFRKQVNRKLLKKDYADLMKMTACASDVLATEQQELYAHFDSAFLHLFPNFVTSVNKLLLPEEQFILKERELLNTELRICALIRLGFVKSAQIAELLHYSPTTIYNYRTRLREKAVSRDVFEEKVMQIQ